MTNLNVHRRCCATEGVTTLPRSQRRYRWVVTDNNGALVYAGLTTETMQEAIAIAARLHGGVVVFNTYPYEETNE